MFHPSRERHRPWHQLLFVVSQASFVDFGMRHVKSEPMLHSTHARWVAAILRCLLLAASRLNSPMRRLYSKRARLGYSEEFASGFFVPPIVLSHVLGGGFMQLEQLGRACVGQRCVCQGFICNRMPDRHTTRHEFHGKIESEE